MRIGYPCTNRTLGCRGGRTLRLASFSLERLDEIVSSNLRCLETMLHFNAEHGIRFFRISSDLIPFASHPRSSRRGVTSTREHSPSWGR